MCADENRKDRFVWNGDEDGVTVESPEGGEVPRNFERDGETEGLEEDDCGKLTSNDAHFHHSTLRERIVEHLFIGETLRRLWQRGVTDVEVLRSEFDAGGYDLVMSRRKVTRHIQFKSVMTNGKAYRTTVNMKLAEKPSGCVIWIVVTPELDSQSYLWLGGLPGEPLPSDICDFPVAKHAKGNAEGTKSERPNHRVVPRTRFDKLNGIDAVLERLFGNLP